MQIITVLSDFTVPQEQNYHHPYHSHCVISVARWRHMIMKHDAHETRITEASKALAHAHLHAFTLLIALLRFVFRGAGHVLVHTIGTAES